MGRVLEELWAHEMRALVELQLLEEAQLRIWRELERGAAF
jgi:hypothetical protein